MGLNLAYYYISLSLITFVVYAIDKSAAKKGRWRTPEKTLHLMALLGGWPGAIIAQKILRHKTQKQPFQIIFWLTVILNIGVLAVFHPTSSSFITNLAVATR